MENTMCPRCGNLLIERKGLFTVENYLEQGSCPRCGNKIYGRFGG
jgi:pyruvate formate lyase activating enzyme